MSEQQYLNLLQDVIDNGVRKNIYAENGKTLPTIDKGNYYEIDKDSKYLSSVVGRVLKFNLTDGKIPLYTSKAVYYPGSFKEMLWFLNDEGDVSKLHQAGFNGWNGWAYKHYLKTTSDNPKLEFSDFVTEYLSKSGVPYFVEVPYTDMTGWQYPDFAESFRQGVPCYKKIDQTKWLIDSIKTAPDRKSYVVQAWNPVRLYAMAKACGNESVVLAACHYSHQVIIQGGLLHLIVNIRSNDLPLGNPFNTAQYGLLAHMYAKCLGYPAAELTVMIGDGHCYSDQVGGVIEQIEKPINDLLPTLTIKDRGQQYLTYFKYSDFKVHNYFPEESIRMPLTIVGGF